MNDFKLLNETLQHSENSIAKQNAALQELLKANNKLLEEKEEMERMNAEYRLQMNYTID